MLHDARMRGVAAVEADDDDGGAAVLDGLQSCTGMGTVMGVNCEEGRDGASRGSI